MTVIIVPTVLLWILIFAVALNAAAVVWQVALQRRLDRKRDSAGTGEAGA
jgi:hypothetical protein